MRTLLICVSIWFLCFAYAEQRPNILFVISDDQSWLHTGVGGDPVVQTPAFDRIANEGILFSNSFTACPSCAPSRASILTGQNFWRLEEGGLLFGRLRTDFPIFTHLLEEAGYETGMTGKGYSPANQGFPNAWKDPCGKPWTRKMKAPRGISDFDYAAGFTAFLEAKPDDKPFCFWFGTKEPHRGYGYGNGAKSGMDLDKIVVPPFLPDNETTRNDVADYLFEIQWFDDHLAKALQLLEERGELENTLIVVTSDNGMPFPRAKATAYNYGVHMPLAVRWGKGVANPGRVVDDFVNHIDFAPTFLEVAGVEAPSGMTGRSLVPLFASSKEGMIDPERGYTVTGLERHVWSRPDGELYPRRVIHTPDYVYIRNAAPDRWPMGSADFKGSHQGTFSDIDSSPSKTFLMNHQDDEAVKLHFDRAFGKLPAEELFDITKDPAQLNNLAENPEYGEIKKSLRKKMEAYTAKTQDPRAAGEAPWKDYPFYKTEYLKGKYLEEVESLKRKE